MTKLNQLAVATVLVVLCSAAHAQGGGVGDEDTPMDPGGLPATQPTDQFSHAQGSLCLDPRVLHLGDGQFTEADSQPWAQSTFVGGDWSASFTADRPITAFVLLADVSHVNTDGAATVRLGVAGENVFSGVVLGTVDFEHNNQGWASQHFAVREPGSFRLTVLSNDREYLGVDDIVFGPVYLIYEPADAFVTPAGGAGAGPVGGPPTMGYLPQNVPGLDSLSGGQATTWGGIWHVAHTGYTMTFLRRGGAAGSVGVVIPLIGGGSPAILDTDGAQWVAPAVGGQWQQLADPHLSFAIGASIPASGALGDSPAVLGTWYASCREANGTTWMMLGDGNCQIDLSDQGQIVYHDMASREMYSFTE